MRQRGAVAILVAVTMIVLLGFLGLAVDGGHLYLTKTELQNSADACSLAASYELTNPTTLTTAAYTRAVAAGQTVALRNLVNFQGSAIVASNVSVTFGTDLKAGTSWVTASTAGSATPRPSYVRCTLTRPSIAMFFMPLLGVGSQTVATLATAGLVPSQSSCVVPMGLCTVGGATTAPFGLTAGTWYNSGSTPSGWVWVGFSGSTSESVLVTQLAGNGVCSAVVGDFVGKVSANGQSTAKAWNTNFGLYQGTTPAAAHPDYAGYAYTALNWSTSNNALNDFLGKRSTNTPYGSSVSNGNSITGLSIKNSYQLATAPSDYQTFGANRRLVAAPIIDCTKLVKNGDTTPVLGWGCTFLLQPFDNPSDAIKVEYEGLASTSGSPCVGLGIPGASTSTGPVVPALVQ